MNPHTHFITLARYNVWATQKLLAAIEPLADADYRRDLGLYFKSIHGTLNHLLVGEHLLWYARFAKGASPLLGLDTEMEPDRERLGHIVDDDHLADHASVAALVSSDSSRSSNEGENHATP